MTTILKGDSSAEITLALAEGCDYSGKTLYLSYQGALRVFPAIEAGGTVAFSFSAKETASMSLGAYPVRIWIRGEDGSMATVHNGSVKLRVTNCIADVRSDEAMYLDVRGGLHGIEGLPDRWNENDLKSKIDEIIRRLGGTVAMLLACALPAFCAGPLTVQTAPKGEVYNDAQVVTNVDFDVSALEAKADATNTYTKAETDAAIVRLAPAPGNYSTVSNAAMNALSRAEVEAGFTEWDFTHAPSLIAGNPELKWNVERGEWDIYLNGVHQTYIPGSIDDIRVNFGSDAEYATRTRLPTMADIPTNNVQLANGAGYVTGAGVTNITEAAVGELSDKLGAEPASGTPFYMVQIAQYAIEAESANTSVSADTAQNADSAFGIADNLTGQGYRTAGKIFSQLDAATATNAAQSAQITAAAQAGTNYTDSAIADADTSYRRVYSLTNLNQTVQFVELDETQTSLAIELPTTGDTKDWLVYVYAAADTRLLLPSGVTWWTSDAANTNAIDAATPTALYFSQVSTNIFMLGRQKLESVGGAL